MSWGEIKKINSDLTTPLNNRMDTRATEINTRVGQAGDAANAAGSLHAKVKELKDYLAAKNIVAYGSAIKSIQKGTINIAAGSYTYGTATISSVNTAKAVVIPLGVTCTLQGTAPSADKFLFRVELTNATTVMAYRGTADGVNAYSVAYAVIEFY